ncbi:ribonuclease P protein component [Flavobacteriaceae bacterium]|nr:ribonuclease P protein component [Flavobacteriaceae bacterium]
MSKVITLNRLKGKELIDTLFRKGALHRSKHLLLKVLEAKESETVLYVGVSVPKHNFKRAVDRNKIKRQLRNALKKVEKQIPFSGACMLIYKGRKHPLTSDLVEGVKEIFNQPSNINSE